MSKEDSEDGTEQIKYLMSLTEEQRTQYCIDVVMSVVNALEIINQIKGKIPKYNTLKKFSKDLQAKKKEIRPVILYMIKPEFRDTFLDVLEKVSGMLEGQL